MTQTVHVDLAGIRKAATEFEAVADKTRTTLNTLRAAAEGKGEPWGNDHGGEQFANGDRGYKAGRDRMYGVLGNLVQVFADNAKNLRDAAQTFETNESNLSRR
ncbi:type VII secretion target [Nocardia sp. CDC159]|uniref:Type VII secretion target n=1 Tax=Nocardia pulmonis TaxID=2951408 RepID=A0A9X2E960_9NOCA|nr:MULTISPECIES: type VII secretion target [Nocardia]MCM6776074.1 type VII secretion target [Nocardia pulmonis]MCM6788599.1 type VII secretion target [Nocardia sp. CDC159]